MRDRSLNSAYLERKLRAIGLAGSSPLQDLSDLAGFLILENDRPEWAFPGGEQLAMFNAGAVAAAAEFSYLAFTNPATSGVLAIFEEIRSIMFPGTGGATNPFSVWYDFSSTALAGSLSTGRGGARDLRLLLPTASGGNVGAIVTDAGNDPVVSATAARQNIMLSGSTNGQRGDSYTQAIILPPGRRIILIGETLNTVIAAAVSWRERPIEGNVEIK